MTYDLLASSVLTSSASSVTFSSISQDYRDLVLVWESPASSSTATVKLILNTDTSTSYSTVNMVGNGSSTSSGSFSDTGIPSGVNYSTGTNLSVNQIMDYSATDKHTTVLTRYNNSTETVRAHASRWGNTAAVTSIQVLAGSNFVVNSSFYLYGISA